MNLFAPVSIAYQREKRCDDGIHCYIITIYPPGDDLYARVEVRRMDETTLNEIGDNNG